MGIGTSFDVTRYAGRKNFTVSNFIVEQEHSDTFAYSSYVVMSRAGAPVSISLAVSMSKSYDPSTGILNAYELLSGSYNYTYEKAGDYSRPGPVHAYLVY